MRLPAPAIEGSLVYLILGSLFEQLCEAHDFCADVVEVEGQSRLKSAVESRGKEYCS